MTISKGQFKSFYKLSRDLGISAVSGYSARDFFLTNGLIRLGFPPRVTCNIIRYKKLEVPYLTEKGKEFLKEKI